MSLSNVKIGPGEERPDADPSNASMIWITDSGQVAASDGSQWIVLSNAAPPAPSFVPAGAIVSNTFLQTITDATPTVVNWDTNVSNIDGFHSVQDSLIVQSGFAGTYLISAAVSFDSAPAGADYALDILVNSVVVYTHLQENADAGNHDVHSPSLPYVLAVNDVVQVQITQVSGGDLNVLPFSGGALPSFFALSRVR